MSALLLHDRRLDFYRQVDTVDIVSLIKSSQLIDTNLARPFYCFRERISNNSHFQIQYHRHHTPKTYVVQISVIWIHGKCWAKPLVSEPEQTLILYLYVQYINYAYIYFTYKNSTHECIIYNTYFITYKTYYINQFVTKRNASHQSTFFRSPLFPFRPDIHNWQHKNLKNIAVRIQQTNSRFVISNCPHY